MIICPERIEEAVKMIEKKELSYADVIIMGDNSSGKSFLLKRLVQNIIKIDDIYYIDAVNRGFVVMDIPKHSDIPQFRRQMIETRIQENYFNIQDSFSFMGTSTEKVERIYHYYEQELQKLFVELTGDSFEILHENQFGEVQFQKGKGLLSSGYQALVRILLELIFYNDQVVEKSKITDGYVIIDEIDEFLSPKYAAVIYPFLKQHFDKLNFIVSTHSIDVVMNAKAAVLFVLDEDGYEVLDVNDYNTFSETKRIFQRVFGKTDGRVPDCESVLRRLLNNRINHAWSESDEKRMEELKNEKLSSSQQLILKQIQNWKE